MDDPAAASDPSPHIQEVENTALTTTKPTGLSSHLYIFPPPQSPQIPESPSILIPPSPPPVIAKKISNWQGRFLKLVKSRPLTTTAFTGIFFLLILAIPTAIRVHRKLRENAHVNRELERQFESLQEQADFLQDQMQRDKDDVDAQHSEQDAKQSKLDDALKALVQKYDTDHDAFLADLQNMKNDTGREFKNLKNDIALYRAANELSKKRALEEFRRSQAEYYDTIGKILKRLDQDEGDADDFMEKTDNELAILTNALLENCDELADHKKSSFNGFEATTDAIRSLNFAVADVDHNFAQTTSTLKDNLRNLSITHAQDRAEIDRLAAEYDTLEQTTKNHQQKLQLVDKHGRKIKQLVNTTDDLRQSQNQIGNELENNRIKNVGSSLLHSLNEDRVTNKPRPKALARRARQIQKAAEQNRPKILIPQNRRNSTRNSNDI